VPEMERAVWVPITNKDAGSRPRFRPLGFTRAENVAFFATVPSNAVQHAKEWFQDVDEGRCRENGRVGVSIRGRNWPQFDSGPPRVASR